MALYEDSIELILSKDPYTNPIFLGALARNELPKQPPYPSCFILNTHPRSKPGEHWLALYYNQKGYCEFFDSYGRSPDFYNLENYIEKTSNGWSFNNIKLQGFSEYCGFYCILFLLMRCRNRSKDFFKFFTNNFIQNDRKIKKLIIQYTT